MCILCMCKSVGMCVCVHACVACVHACVCVEYIQIGRYVKSPDFLIFTFSCTVVVSAVAEAKGHRVVAFMLVCTSQH